ncbi:MAG: queuosine precursor transporter [Wolbachia endosymbiont of Fragariocoptes setiger]|nr:queuosine precursor transporter [Wolbachia endosymbiont of Fragariocoptes setiger]
MKIEEKIYTCLSVLFVVFIVIGNLTYQKFISLPIISIELSVGAILYPLTFSVTDLIAEFYGKVKAQFCIKLAVIMNIITAIIIIFMDNLNAVSWSQVDNEIFHTVFGKYSVNFIASIIACYVAQLIDVRIYLRIKNITKNKFLWLRNNCSTIISLFVDTFIVVSILSLFGVIPKDKMFSIIFGSYSFKVLFTICNTPMFYFGVWIVKRLNRLHFRRY